MVPIIVQNLVGIDEQFRKYEIFNILPILLENSYSRPLKIGGLERFCTPQTWSSVKESPKKDTLARVRVFCAIKHENPLTGLTLSLIHI